MESKNSVNGNVFVEALTALLDSAKTLQRKNWANLLGVSESAISQWVKGKTFPEADKLRMIVAIARKLDLDNDYKEKLEKFISMLEYHPSQFPDYIAKKIKSKTISTYALTELNEESQNSISLLFYDLKAELLNHYLREVEIIKNVLEKKILDIPKDGSDFHYKVVKTKLLQKAIAEKSNAKPLSNYAKIIREIHLAYNDSLRSTLEEIDIYASFEESFEFKVVQAKYSERAKEKNLMCNALPSRETVKEKSRNVSLFPNCNSEKVVYVLNYDKQNQGELNPTIMLDKCIWTNYETWGDKGRLIEKRILKRLSPRNECEDASNLGKGLRHVLFDDNFYCKHCSNKISRANNIRPEIHLNAIAANDNFLCEYCLNSSKISALHSKTNPCVNPSYSIRKHNDNQLDFSHFGNLGYSIKNEDLIVDREKVGFGNISFRGNLCYNSEE